MPEGTDPWGKPLESASRRRLAEVDVVSLSERPSLQPRPAAAAAGRVAAAPASASALPAVYRSTRAPSTTHSLTAQQALTLRFRRHSGGADGDSRGEPQGPGRWQRRGAAGRTAEDDEHVR